MGKGRRGGKGQAHRGGGGGKGRGKGKGKSQKKRRAAREAFEEAAEASAAAHAGLQRPAPTTRRGAAAAPARAAAAEGDIEPPAAAPARAKPGFGSLLQAFGVEESDADSDGDEDDADDGGSGECEDEEEEEDEDEREDLAGKGSRGAGKAELGAGKALDEDDEDGEEEEEEQDAEAEALEAAKAVPAPQPQAGDLLDFFPRFWEDPPRGLIGASAREPAAASADGAPQRFSWPELSRCEARRRDVGKLLALSKADPSEALARCGLAPGLQRSFGEFLSKRGLQLGPRDAALFLFQHAYLDVAFPEHTHLSSQTVRAVLALHAVDHVLKATAEVLANSAKLNAAKRSGEAATGAEGDSPAADLGFSRPRVLILCPFRSVCRAIVGMMAEMLPGKRQVINHKRFEEEYGADDEGEDEDAVKRKKPADWLELFGGNSDDRFRIGIAVSRKNFRLYSPFDKSDILICSPLGLREVTGAEGEKKREFDFLSSIELLVLDRADVLRMQNWEHVQEILKVVNHKPQLLKGIDISRLRPAFAEGRAREFRQTVATAAAFSMDMQAVFITGPQAQATHIAPRGLKRKLGSAFSRRNRQAVAESSDEEANEDEMPAQLLQQEQARAQHSCRGLVCLVDAPAGEPLRRTSALGVSQQFFMQVPCASVREHGEKMFEAFVSKYWKPLGITLERLLIVCNSYFSFLQLRRFFRDEGTPFCSAFEYSSPSDLSRARGLFFRGDRRVLLVTERFLWYRRYHLKGADYVLFYGPPETPEIYEEVLNGARVPSQCTSMCLYASPDGFALERIVGHERARRMLAAQPGQVFVFR